MAIKGGAKMVKVPTGTNNHGLLRTLSPRRSRVTGAWPLGFSYSGIYGERACLIVIGGPKRSSAERPSPRADSNTLAELGR